jgi:hypothetical protein
MRITIRATTTPATTPIMTPTWLSLEVEATGARVVVVACGAWEAVLDGDAAGAPMTQDVSGPSWT